MANYQLLKADIDAKVYENAYREITGEKLNSVLNAMVTTLGAEYQFAGVATIDTNPGTPDAKVFYIANGKGTYEKFGGINITEDDVVVLYWDSSWHKVSTGIASQEKLSELESKTDQQFSQLENYSKTNFELITTGNLFNVKGYINTSGDLSSAPDWRTTNFIPCSEGDIFIISIPTTSKATFRVSYYNVNYSFINGIETDGKIIIPSGVSYLRATGYATDKNTILKCGIELNQLKNEVINIKSNIENIGANFLNKEEIDFYQQYKYFSSTFNIVKLPIETFITYSEKHYINQHGEIKELNSYDVIRCPFMLDFEIGIINLKRTKLGEEINIHGCIEFMDGTFDSLNGKYNDLSDSTVGQPISKKIKYIYVNVLRNGDCPANYIQVVLCSPTKTLPDNKILCGTSLGTLYDINKYVHNNGTLNTLNGCRIYKHFVDRDNIDYYIENTPGIPGACFDGTGCYLGAFTDYTAGPLPVGTKYVLVNYKYDTNFYGVPRNVKNKNFCTVIGEKIDFTGKSIAFIGDSITAGVGASDEAHRWVTLFANKLITNNGLSSYRNLGSSGATFASGLAGRSQIEEMIRNASITEDVIIVAAGVNDFNLNVPLGTADSMDTSLFYGALNSLTSYLNENYSNKKVIFVLPIGFSSVKKFANEYNSYREIIFACAEKYGFCVIDGSEFGFPCNTQIMPDGLHPSDLGHRIYANKMYDTLG